MTRTERRAASTSLALAVTICATGFAVGFALKPVTVTYELQHTDRAGDVFVLDYGLSADDCARRMSDFPAELALTCAPVFN